MVFEVGDNSARMPGTTLNTPRHRREWAIYGVEKELEGAGND